MSSSKVLAISHSETNDSAARECVDVLRASGVVVVPTETVYGVAALADDCRAIQKLLRAKKRDARHTLAVAVTGWEMAARYVAGDMRYAAKLARLFWPGPLTMILPANALVDSLPREAREAIAPNGEIGIRAPRNTFLNDVLRLLDKPIALTSANISGEPPATNAEQARAALDGRVELIIDGGSAALGAPSTVARVQGRAFEILREGEISRDALRDAARKTILFLCGANTCRSVMAEAICQRLLCIYARKENAQDFRALSAGIDAFAGDPPTQFACETIEKYYNISIASARARRVHYRMIEEADLIYCMDEAQRQAAIELDPECEPRVKLLDPDGAAIEPPNEESEDAYRRCALKIEVALRKRLQETLQR